MSAAGEGLTEPILYLRRKAQMQTSLATWTIKGLLIKIWSQKTSFLPVFVFMGTISVIGLNVQQRYFSQTGFELWNHNQMHTLAGGFLYAKTTVIS